MNKLISTSEIIDSAVYFDTAESFFANFSNAWNSVKGQVLKLETKQNYDESGNESYDLLVSGKFKEAISIIPKIREVDLPLYKDLKRRNIDFIRCRPIIKPYSEYLKWEFECYKFNATHCERIFVVDRNILIEIFEKIAVHDFMVFDYNLAFIHNYNNNGKIEGGWKITNNHNINHLIYLFAIIKAHSVNYLSM